jgi:hypothetical protein
MAGPVGLAEFASGPDGLGPGGVAPGTAASGLGSCNPGGSNLLRSAGTLRLCGSGSGTPGIAPGMVTCADGISDSFC